MSYRLIKGEFHAHYPDYPRGGPEPDGDTLKFRPDNPALVVSLHQRGNTGPNFNARGMINLRFQGIDALETHFNGTHQHIQWAEAARDYVLDAMGYTDVQFFDDLPSRIRSIRNHPSRGYVLASGLDEHGRIIAFIFTSDADYIDGAVVELDEVDILSSLNAQLLQRGVAYPAFYAALASTLRNQLANLVRDARQRRTGFWPLEHVSVTQPATITSQAELRHMVMWPKLFRRLSRYFGSGYADLSQFGAWLRMDGHHRNDSLILPDREFGFMHDIFTLDDASTMRLRFHPEDLIILPYGHNHQATLNAFPAHRPRPTTRLTPATPRTRTATGGVKQQQREPDVRIVALLPNPRGNDEGKERITLINASPFDVDLNFWALVDRSGGQEPLSGTIKSGDVLQIQPRRLSQVVMGNKGDTLTLVDADGNTIDQATYTSEDIKRSGVTLIFGD